MTRLIVRVPCVRGLGTWSSAICRSNSASSFWSRFTAADMMEALLLRAFQIFCGNSALIAAFMSQEIGRRSREGYTVRVALAARRRQGRKNLASRWDGVCARYKRGLTSDSHAGSTAGSVTDREPGHQGGSPGQGQGTRESSCLTQAAKKIRPAPDSSWRGLQGVHASFTSPSNAPLLASVPLASQGRVRGSENRRLFSSYRTASGEPWRRPQAMRRSTRRRRAGSAAWSSRRCPPLPTPRHTWVSPPLVRYHALIPRLSRDVSVFERIFLRDAAPGVGMPPDPTSFPRPGQATMRRFREGKRDNLPAISPKALIFPR